MDYEINENLDLVDVPKTQKPKKRKRKATETNVDLDTKQIKLNNLDELKAESNHEPDTTEKAIKAICVKCQKEKKIYFESMCKRCYRAEENNQVSEETDVNSVPTDQVLKAICVKCQKEKKIHFESMCKRCYKADLKAQGEAEENNQVSEETDVNSAPTDQVLKAICVKCQKEKKIHSESMCKHCYNAELKAQREAEENTQINEETDVNPASTDQVLKSILERIEKCSSVQLANLVIKVRSTDDTSAQFEQFSKVKIDAVETPILEEGSEADDSPPLKKSKSTNTKEKTIVSSTKASQQSDDSANKAPSKPTAKTPKKVNMKECVDCHETKPHRARGRCSTCYSRFMKQKKKEDAEKAKNAEESEQEA